MTRRAQYRLRGMGSREEKRQSIQGFNANEEVIPRSVYGNPSVCHPGLDPGSRCRSYPRTKNLDAQRRNEEPVLLGGDGGPLTDNAVFISVQRLLDRDAETSSDDARGGVSSVGSRVSRRKASHSPGDLFEIMFRFQRDILLCSSNMQRSST